MIHPGSHRFGQVVVPFAAGLAWVGVAWGQPIISEIMYNPASDESPPNDVEWVEIYNPTEAPVDLSGWYLTDEDGRTEGIPEETVLKPDAALVLIPGKQTVEDFRAAWGGTESEAGKEAAVVSLGGWQGPGGLAGLSNAPSSKNEVLELRSADPEADPVDVVNYDDTDPWPSDAPQGASIYLKPEKLNDRDNDRGEDWARSRRYFDHAIRSQITEDFDAREVGSPGRVATEPIDATPEPEPEPVEPESDSDSDSESAGDGHGDDGDAGSSDDEGEDDAGSGDGERAPEEEANRSAGDDEENAEPGD